MAVKKPAESRRPKKFKGVRAVKDIRRYGMPATTTDPSWTRREKNCRMRKPRGARQR